MNHLKTFILFLVALLAASANALSLYTWRPTPNIPPLVIGVRESETPTAAARRYVDAISQDPAYADLLKKSPLPNMPLRGFAPLRDDDFARRTLLIANRPEDYASQGNWRIDSFKTPLESDQVVPYMVPFSGDAGLSSEESEELIALLDKDFPPFVAMGGADNDLVPFGGSNAQSIDVNPARDRFERRLLTHKLQSIRTRNSKWVPSFLQGQKREDRLGGICRGAQLIALITGQGVQPHVEGHGRHNEKPSASGEGGGQSPICDIPEPLHSLRVFQTTRNLTARVLQGEGEQPLVNSYHHQAGIFNPGLGMELAAENPIDGVVEAMESSDGNIWLMQFHPELMLQRSRGEVQTLGAKFMHAFAHFLTPMSCSSYLEP